MYSQPVSEQNRFSKGPWQLLEWNAIKVFVEVVARCTQDP
jgi:hypothetical protein